MTSQRIDETLDSRSAGIDLVAGTAIAEVKSLSQNFAGSVQRPENLEVQSRFGTSNKSTKCLLENAI